uniref:Prolyl 4-hydroxylase alpha subunit Fe(2+) 2OG dioxygenase domain-containing protein n=1 Tax=Lotharella globosa TaxID=91324 RepID=A0A7S3YX91_9EUKA
MHVQGGWEELFDDKEILRLAPKPGRLLLFGSGFQNPHRARVLNRGCRTCLEMWFTFSHKEAYDQLEDFQILEHGPPKPRNIFQVDLDRIDDDADSYRDQAETAIDKWNENERRRQPIERMHKENWIKKHNETLRRYVSKHGPPKTAKALEDLIKRVEKRNGTSLELEEALAGV